MIELTLFLIGVSLGAQLADPASRVANVALLAAVAAMIADLARRRRSR